MGAKVEKRPLTDNMEQFTDLYFSGTGGDPIFAEETD